MFQMRMLAPGEEQVQEQQLALAPDDPQSEQICDLFHRFLMDKPQEFRLRLPFLKRDEIEMEWAAAPGGAALCSFYEDDSPLASAVLLAGANAESDQQMSALFDAAVIQPIFGVTARKVLQFTSYPAMAVAMLAAPKERYPVVQLFYASLASVYFRQIAALSGGSSTERN